jgi:hypothetical protein
MAGYPHFYLAEDGRLCSMGQHCSGFLRVLYDALLRLGYKGDAPIYCCQLSMAHGVKSVRGQCDDTHQPLGAMVVVHHWQ